jgi:hypothetical protein
VEIKARTRDRDRYFGDLLVLIGDTGRSPLGDHSQCRADSKLLKACERVHTGLYDPMDMRVFVARRLDLTEDATPLPATATTGELSPKPGEGSIVETPISL